jgi:hypothetical protein
VRDGDSNVRQVNLPVLSLGNEENVIVVEGWNLSLTSWYLHLVQQQDPRVWLDGHRWRRRRLSHPRGMPSNRCGMTFVTSVISFWPRLLLSSLAQ